MTPVNNKLIIENMVTHNIATSNLLSTLYFLDITNVIIPIKIENTQTRYKVKLDNKVDLFTNNKTIHILIEIRIVKIL